MKRIPILFAALLSLAVPALADDSERSALVIDSGRLGVMMDQSRAMLPALTPPGPAPEGPDHERIWIFENLVSAVLDYNVLSHQACRDGVVSGVLCTGPYLPRWLGAKASDFSDKELRAMTDEAGGRLMPFWSALCDKTPKPADDGLVCPME